MKTLPPANPADTNGKSAGGGRNGNGRDFEPGHDPRRGHGPPKGHGGRPTNKFKADMQRLVTSHNVPEEILVPVPQEVADELRTKHPAVWVALESLRLRAWTEAADRGFFKPRPEPEGVVDLPEVVEVTRKLSPEEWRKKYVNAADRRSKGSGT